MSSRAPDTSAGQALSLNLAWAERFVAALEAGGVRDAVIAPGSRSAPLALALDRSALRTHVALDERAGGFFALGMAKGGRRPVVVLTTSGTAAANLLPAIVEASHGRVPLIVLTADRPPELRDTGAPQTIDQIKLFGGFVRWFCEVGTPAPGADLLEYVGALGARAAAEAWRAPAAPVHLNFAFREPLLPEPEDLPAATGAGRRTSPAPGPDEARHPEPMPPAPRAIARVAMALRVRRCGLIVCGPDDPSGVFPAEVARLAAVTGYPILADPASQVRFGPHEQARVLGAYDAVLRAPGFAASAAPEAIVQFGAPLTSKAFHLYAARHAGAWRVTVDPAGRPRDPSRRACEVLAADSAPAAAALADALQEFADPLPSWLARWTAADGAARAVIASAVRSGVAPADGELLARLVPALPDGAALYVGNSMAIRDLDAFAPVSPRRVRVLANRGANGIDGLVSSALGASTAVAGPLVLVTGDLSFHHDLNALQLARGGRARATIVILHNDGGGIFSFLPVARHGETFERLFATPHGLDFEPVAALYGASFRSAGDAAEAAEAALDSIAAGGTRVIQLRSGRAASRAAHQSVWDAAVRAVESLG